MDEVTGRRRAVAPAVVLSVLPQTAFAVLLVAHPAVFERFPLAVDPTAGWAYGALGLLAAASTLLLQRRAPGPGVAVTGVFAVSAFAIVPLVPFALFPLAVAIVVAVARGALWWAVGTVAVALLLPLGQLFLVDRAGVTGRSVGILLILVIALGAGAFVRARLVRAAEAAVRRADRQRIAVEQERVRIARELHDVLAHSLSSISVQAGVGLHLAADRPQAAVEALETIRGASRAALDEVRGVLGLLRSDDAAPRAPEPDLGRLDALVDEARRTGARIELDDRLLPRPPMPVQLALYRIVQESMTNARRHAPGAAVSIALAYDGDEAVARVEDHLPGARAVLPVAGNGLTGMRERAAALHGRLEVLVHEDGLAVVARLPVPTAPA